MATIKEILRWGFFIICLLIVVGIPAIYINYLMEEVNEIYFLLIFPFLILVTWFFYKVLGCGEWIDGIQ